MNGRTTSGRRQPTLSGSFCSLGLSLDTYCLRERIFFGLLVINFVAGCGVTLWHSIPSADVRGARIGTGILWALAALASLTTLGGAAEIRGKG